MQLSLPQAQPPVCPADCWVLHVSTRPWYSDNTDAPYGDASKQKSGSWHERWSTTLHNCDMTSY